MSWPDDIEQNISVLETLARAMRLHRSGQLGQADAAYRLVLAVQPRNADALYQLSPAELRTRRRRCGVALH